MPIGPICAIPQELTHLRAMLTDSHSEEAAHTVFVAGTIDGYDVVLAGSGMGKVNAALVATLLADRFGCHTVVFSGMAGGLDLRLAIGDIVVADFVIKPPYWRGVRRALRSTADRTWSGDSKAGGLQSVEDQTYRHRTLTDRGGRSLDRAATHVADTENSGP